MMTTPQHDSIKRSDQKAPEHQPEISKYDATRDLPRRKAVNGATRVLTPAVQRVVDWHRQRAQPHPQNQTQQDQPSAQRAAG